MARKETNWEGNEREAGTPDPTADMRPLCWIEVPVSDVKLAAKRLEGLFGWKVQEPTSTSFALLLTGNRDPIGLSLVMRESASGARDEPSTTLIGVNIGSKGMEDVYHLAVTMGFMPVEAPHAVPEAGHGLRAVLRDPDGNLFGLWHD